MDASLKTSSLIDLTHLKHYRSAYCKLLYLASNGLLHLNQFHDTDVETVMLTENKHHIIFSGLC